MDSKNEVILVLLLILLAFIWAFVEAWDTKEKNTCHFTPINKIVFACPCGTLIQAEGKLDEVRCGNCGKVFFEVLHLDSEVK